MTTPDLTALVLTVTSSEPLLAPAHLGRAAYALFLRLIDAHDPALAKALHNQEGPKPFTCSGLIGGRRKDRDTRQYLPERPAWLRFTGLTADVSNHLLRLAQHPPTAVELDGHIFQVQSTTLAEADHPWANQTDYQTLAEPYLLATVAPEYRLSLQFASPTTFRSNEMIRPVPMADWVFGSLLDRWNTFSPVQISPEIRRFASECVALSQYQLRTRAVPLKEHIVYMGCVGRATYAIVKKDKYWASLLNLLSQYAFYSGVGYQTTAGLGQTRVQDPRARNRQGNLVSDEDVPVEQL